MADPKPVLQSVQPGAERPAKVAQRRIARLDPDVRAARDALIAEAERIMGVSPILGRTGPRPGY